MLSLRFFFAALLAATNLDAAPLESKEVTDLRNFVPGLEKMLEVRRTQYGDVNLLQAEMFFNESSQAPDLVPSLADNASTAYTYTLGNSQAVNGTYPLHFVITPKLSEYEHVQDIALNASVPDNLQHPVDPSKLVIGAADALKTLRAQKCNNPLVSVTVGNSSLNYLKANTTRPAAYFAFMAPMDPTIAFAPAVYVRADIKPSRVVVLGRKADGNYTTTDCSGMAVKDEW